MPTKPRYSPAKGLKSQATTRKPAKARKPATEAPRANERPLRPWCLSCRHDVADADALDALEQKFRRARTLKGKLLVMFEIGVLVGRRQVH